MVDVLSARPPTPPRTASRMLSERDGMGNSPVIVQTPIDSSFLSNGSTGALSSRQSKRVNFSPWPKYIKPPTFTNPKSQVLLPSNDLKPARSILKSTNSPGPVCFTDVTSYTPETFAMLLESVTQQLAGESTSSRVDAYMQFFGALRAYEKLPTEEEIVRKLGLITTFIQRDISRDLARGGPLDTNLVIQALKLSVVLVWHPQISAQLPDDFKLFLIEHSVSRLEDGKLPKSVMTHYLSVLSTQRFQAKIITPSRVTRILTMLHALTDRVKGNSVVSQRLMIYDRIFELSKSAFVSHSALWMDHLISGLLHQIGDVRLKAMELGFHTYTSSGANPTLSKTLRDIFDRPLPNKRKMVSEICERMSRMMANPETGEHVPQIWGTITLLLRSKRFSIDQWQHFKEWVLVLQKCFNCSDSDIKSKAIYNWNRFVLVVNISETTSRSLLKMLSKPLLSQFERKKHDKQGSQPSQLVLSSYYNLLYYAFRPDASYRQLDIVWEEYIALPSAKIFASMPSLSDRLAHALSNMLWSSHPLKAWSDNRVNEPKRIVAEELPPLDCRWVRSRIPAILKVFEDILKSSVWEPEMEKSNIAVAWVNLSHALAFAASKEITPSQESMQAVAHVLGLLQRAWNAGPPSLNAVTEISKDIFFDRFRFLSTTMVIALGSIPFTEKLLLKTADSTYQASNTPTRRHLKAANNPDSPILHLLRLISDVSEISGPTSSYSRLINDTVSAACHGRTARGPRLDILRQCADLYPSGHEFHFGVNDFAQIVWKSTAQLSADCLRSYPIESARERDGNATRDYENVVKLLSTGMQFSGIFAVWDQLIDAFIRVLRAERGDNAVATILLEPLAASMLSLDIHKTYLPASSIFNHSLSIFLSDFDDNTLLFPSNFLELAHRTLNDSYQNLELSDMNDVTVFIDSIVSILGSGSTALRSMMLDKLQKPLGLYLTDTSLKLKAENGVESGILTAGHTLSTVVINILQLLPQDNMHLQKYKHILCSGLGSSHISTGKIFADCLTSTFGARSLTYPEPVLQALRRFEAHFESQATGPGPVKASPPQRESEIDTEGVKITSGMSVESHTSFDADVPPHFSRNVESLPVITGIEAAATALSKREPSPPRALFEDALHPSANLGEAAVSISKEESTRHNEVFSMIDNLRSSSPPANTPRQAGFMTPPRLHHLQHEGSETTTPQTPTIPAVSVDNEDGFLGSSPTPAIRGRNHSVGSAVPPSSLAAADGMELDPPSSPPDIERETTDFRNSTPSILSPVKDRVGKSKKRRNRSKRSRRLKQNSGLDSPRSEQSEPNSQRIAAQSLRNRLRSATDDLLANSEKFAGQQTLEVSNKMFNESNNNLTTASSLNRESKQNQQPKGADGIDSDMDTQATSQLEMDLVSAVTPADSSADREIMAFADQALLTRKRKREVEANAFSQASKERRRSSRLSTTAPGEGEESQTRSKKKTLSATSHEPLSIPVGSARKRTVDATDPKTKSPKSEQFKRDKDQARVSETQGSSQIRRSFRLSGGTAPDIPEDSPTPKRSPRPNNTQKQSKSQKNSQADIPQSHSAEEIQEAPVDESTLAFDTPDPIEDINPPSFVDETAEKRPERQPPQPELPGPQIDQDAQLANESDVQMVEVQETIETRAEPELEPAPEPGSLVSHVPETETDNQPSPEPVQPDLSPALPDPVSLPQQEQEQEKEAEPEPPTSNAQIATSLRSILEQVKLTSLDRDGVKEMDDILFDLRVEMHEALRRHNDNAAATSL
ncbi:Rap1-interacting factor 1 N terminal-domain-containing protein [Aspergillus californicus]